MATGINKYDLVSGDGGPMIVLQSSVVPLWQGAADFDNSLMNGGTVETDYDVICEFMGGIFSLRRYERDMLVLDDSEWGARFVASDAGEIVVLQRYGWDEEDPDDEIFMRALLSSPSETFPLTIEDRALRLLVGASSGDQDNGGQGGSWGIAEVAVTPGPKVCDVYASKEGQMAVLRPAAQYAT